jgi:hypothetical protein
MSDGTADRDVGRTETLSELLARILTQLALSAWLPSAALTALLWFVLALGTALDTGSDKPDKAISATFAILAQTQLGGVVAALGLVAVLTLLTQAFSFEAIRALEGYWGTGARVERLAEKSRRRHLERRKRIVENLRTATTDAWESAAAAIKAKNAAVEAIGREPPFTPPVVEALRVKALRGRRPPLTEAEQLLVMRTDWRSLADGELLRRRVGLMKRLEDYPIPRHVLPTRLGNVLRHFEDKTEHQEVESLVEDRWDRLPFSLKLRHDELRGRLEIYCSMVFVAAFVGVFAAIRFAGSHPPYALAACVIAIAGMVFFYNAAVASARAYGPLLRRIARYEPVSPSPEVSQSSG